MELGPSLPPAGLALGEVVSTPPQSVLGCPPVATRSHPSGEGRAWRPFGGPVPQDPVGKMLVGTPFHSCVTFVCFLGSDFPIKLPLPRAVST